MPPVDVTKLLTTTVQATCVPPPFCSPLHCDAGAALAGVEAEGKRLTPTSATATTVATDRTRHQRSLRIGDRGGNEIMAHRFHMPQS